jgi:uncharacterized membrane protein YhaH (DUF805 family)
LHQCHSSHWMENTTNNRGRITRKVFFLINI